MLGLFPCGDDVGIKLAFKARAFPASSRDPGYTL